MTTEPITDTDQSTEWRYILDPHPDASWWEWTVSGTEDNPHSSMVRDHTVTGLVRAEGAGEALNWLVEHGPMWDCLDPYTAFTVAIRPADDEQR